eukprot:ANDGO_06054.mRNA.1 hypothetical protein
MDQLFRDVLNLLLVQSVLPLQRECRALHSKYLKSFDLHRPAASVTAGYSLEAGWSDSGSSTTQTFICETFHPDGTPVNRITASGQLVTKSKKLPKAAVDHFKLWMVDHYTRPYPTEAEKQAFCKEFSVSIAQVNNWFINSRVRTWRPIVKKAATAFATGASATLVSSSDSGVCLALTQQLYGKSKQKIEAAVSEDTVVDGNAVAEDDDSSDGRAGDQSDAWT